MNRVVLDSSYIVAFIFEKDRYHSKAMEIFNELPGDTIFYTHFLVVQETATVLCRRCKEKGFDCKKVLRVFEDFLKGVKVLDITYKTEEIVDDMGRNNCKLSYVDIVLLKTSDMLKANLLTFDESLLLRIT